MIRLDRVVLRRFEPKDVERLYAFRNDNAITSGLVGFSVGYSREDLLQWVEAHRSIKNELLWAITEAETDKCIGHVGLYQIDHRVRKAEFGILIGDVEWQGKGIGKQVSHTVVSFGFDSLNLRRIALSVLADNVRAIRLYSQLGFKEEGILRDDVYQNGRYADTVLMSLLRSEWT